MLKRDEVALNKDAWCGLNRPEGSEQDADIVVFGIPYDKGVSYRGGACQGPSVLRQNTLASTPYTERFESMEALNVFDAGDFLFEEKHQSREDYFAEIEEYVCRLVKQGRFFTMVIITECWGHRARKIGKLEK